MERIIGEGSMGLVVEATHLDLDERVALKFLHREARARPDIVARFAREARAAARIKNDHVARVFDVGGTDDGALFIVMEFLDGMDLDAMIATRGALGIAEAVEFTIEACEGLAAAHAHGIVHRDIKPANLFITDRAGLRQVKLLDFGISKAGITGGFEDIDLAGGQTTQIMGSPHYMSPEQIRSTKDVDVRADLWSLGVVLFEILTNTTPFDATEVTGIIAQVLHSPHRTVRSLRPDVPPELEAVIDRCLRKDPAKRYQSAADLAAALLPFAPKRARGAVERSRGLLSRASGTVEIDSLPPPPSAAQTNSNVVIPMMAVPSFAPAPPRKSFVWVALAAVILGLSGGLFAMFARVRSPDAVTPTTAMGATAQPTGAAPSTTPVAAVPSETATASAAPSDTAAPSATGAMGATPTTPTATAVTTNAAWQRPPPRPIPRATAVVRSASPTAAPPPKPESEIRHER